MRFQGLGIPQDSTDAPGRCRFQLDCVNAIHDHYGADKAIAINVGTASARDKHARDRNTPRDDAEYAA